MKVPRVRMTIDKGFDVHHYSLGEPGREETKNLWEQGPKSEVQPCGVGCTMDRNAVCWRQTRLPLLDYAGPQPPIGEVLLESEPTPMAIG